MEEVDPDESSIHDGQQWSTNTSKSRSSFSEAGVRMRTGMWSVEEKQLLEKNIERFLAKHPGVTMEQVVFDWTKAQRKGVYRKVGKGIRRPLNNIYTYLKRRYHPHETSGAYTPDEELKLMSLYEKYGARWTKIGRKMDRSPETVCLKYRSLVEAEKIVSTFGGIKPGKWSSSDDSLLEQAVRELSGTDSVDKPVLWDSVSLRVPGKSAKQCRQRWSSTLAQQGDGQQWGLTNDIEMINVLFETQVTITIISLVS